MSPPSNVNDWLNITNDLGDCWNLLHVVGAIDGKHIQIQYPSKTGTLYHNYKGFLSIVLLAACNAKYSFTLVDMGHYGSNNNNGIGRKFEWGEINLPNPSILEGCSFNPLHYYMVGDEIFPLKTWLMRPYPGKLTEEQKIFNYRLSWASLVIKNAFGILVTRWRIFLTPISASVENVQS